MPNTLDGVALLMLQMVSYLFLGLAFQKVLCLIDLTGEIWRTTTIGMVCKHNSSMGFLQFCLLQLRFPTFTNMALHFSTDLEACGVKFSEVPTEVQE